MSARIEGGTVVVLTTGGTIASRLDESGAAVASLAGADVVGTAAGDVDVRVREVFRTGSYLLGLDRLVRLREAVAAELADPEVVGIVITHGTDTIEESAIALDLDHHDPRPIVLTGAQRSADAPDGDGPRNLRDALDVARDLDARSRGVLVAFDGRILPAAGLRKSHTLDLRAFDGPVGAVGRVREGEVHFPAGPTRRSLLDTIPARLAEQRIPVVWYNPGDSAEFFEAALRESTGGVVLVGTGAGNASPAVAAALEQATRAGSVVVLTTRVPDGPVVAVYGNGGGADLLRAGAVLSGTFRAAQARVVLAAALAAGHGRASVAALLAPA
jgi:L-asparaginase